MVCIWSRSATHTVILLQRNPKWLYLFGTGLSGSWKKGCETRVCICVLLKDATSTSSSSSTAVDLTIQDQQELGYMPLRDEFDRVCTSAL